MQERRYPFDIYSDLALEKLNRHLAAELGGIPPNSELAGLAVRIHVSTEKLIAYLAANFCGQGGYPAKFSGNWDQS